MYGYDVKDWWKAFGKVVKADLMLIIGTSLTTYPANELPVIAERNGCKVIKINEDCISAFKFFEDELEKYNEMANKKYTERENELYTRGVLIGDKSNNILKDK